MKEKQPTPEEIARHELGMTAQQMQDLTPDKSEQLQLILNARRKQLVYYLQALQEKVTPPPQVDIKKLPPYSFHQWRRDLRIVRITHHVLQNMTGKSSLQ